MLKGIFNIKICFFFRLREVPFSNICSVHFFRRYFNLANLFLHVEYKAPSIFESHSHQQIHSIYLLAVQIQSSIPIIFKNPYRFNSIENIGNLRTLIKYLRSNYNNIHYFISNMDFTSFHKDSDIIHHQSQSWNILCMLWKIHSLLQTSIFLLMNR